MTFKEIQSKYLTQIENELHSSIQFKIKDDKRTILKDAILYSVSAPGKRIRPLLCMSIEKGLSSNQMVGLPIGIAIELIHCYSLIHDDLPAMDNDDFRRGIPTCHKKFGEDIAILAGDTLNTYAFEYLINKLENNVDSEKVMKIIKKLSQACGINGMAGGQVLDLQTSLESTSSIEDIKKIHSLKTGALLESCFNLTSIAITNDEETIQILNQIGQHFGLLFQIVDDILDETGTLEELGKSPGKDIQQNKLTFTSKLGLKNAKDFAFEEKEKALKLIKLLPSPISDLNVIINYIYLKGAKNVN